MTLQVLNRDADRGQQMFVATVTVPSLAASSSLNVQILPAGHDPLRVHKFYVYNIGATASADADVTLEADDGSTETALTAAHAIDSNTADTLDDVAVTVVHTVTAAERLQAHVIENGGAAATGDIQLMVVYSLEPSY